MRCRRCNKDLDAGYIDFDELLKKAIFSKNHKFIRGNFVYCRNCAKQTKYLADLMKKYGGEK